jgi:hypothetical protein
MILDKESLLFVGRVQNAPSAFRSSRSLISEVKLNLMCLSGDNWDAPRSIFRFAEDLNLSDYFGSSIMDAKL